MRLGAAAVLKKLPQVERRAWMALFVRAIQVGEGAPRKLFFIQLFVELLVDLAQVKGFEVLGIKFERLELSNSRTAARLMSE